MKKKVKHCRIDRAATDLGQTARDPSCFLPALGHLGQALLAGRARQEDPWNYAATFSDLALLGLSSADCRLLVSQDLISARNKPSSRSGTGRNVAGLHHEPSATGQDKGVSASSRRASRNRPLAIGPRTRFILSDAGLAYLMKHTFAAHGESAPSARGQGEGYPSVAPSPALPISPSQFHPHYDIDLRELIVAGELILSLRLQARNLTAVLEAFQLAGWPPRVVKPLHGFPEASDPQRLADAVYGLNHHQSLIEFRTDGATIRWQWRKEGETIHRSFHGR